MAGAQSVGGNHAGGQMDQGTNLVFTNRGLFSGYYLGTLLAREVRAHQGEMGTRMPLNVRRRLHRIWDDVSLRFGSSTGYARTRQAWIEPLLAALGYEPLEPARATDFSEESLPNGYFLYWPEGSDTLEQPDLSLPTSETTETAGIATAYAPPDDDEYGELEPDGEENDRDETAVEVADAVPTQSVPTAVLLSLVAWDDDFDRPFATARRRSETPHQLMERLLAAGPAQWGLLLNGQKVRLLKRNVVAGRQQYLEVDLEALFDAGTDRDFDTFWTLFRAQAFQPDAQGRCLLDVVDEGSRKHAEGVSSTLKNSVFSAMERLMSTLVERAQELVRAPADPRAAAAYRRQKAEEALSNVKALYEQSLVLLYRMLFVLYAESRELLPVDNPIYRDSYSLEPLRDEVEQPNVAYEPDSFRLWETAQALFRLIHRGCRTTELVVPAYNGQLFTPASTDLLNAIRVPDDAMAEVLRQLSMTPATKDRGRERISYRDLGVEQLGSVYEGLLEYEPRVAAEPMVEVRYKNQLAVIPAREQKDYSVLRTFQTGQFYLGRGAGRKTTGSYYTPQPLVDFLVRRTLGPLVEGKSAEEILELKVVDPAMGSGAFLVGSCLYLAEAYARALRREETATHEAVGEIELDTEAPGPEGEEEDLSEEATRPYRRLVAERCIYGVDLNPMAVELAKVSLWLTTLAGDKPLTFLDAHLRCGNSLIGAPLHPYTDASGKRHYGIDTIHPEANRRLQKGRGGATRSRAQNDGRQAKLFSDAELTATVEPLVGRLSWIAQTPSDTVERVHEKEELFRRQVEGDRERTQLKAVCDLWVATWFWRQPPADAKPGDESWTPPMDGYIYRQLAQHLRGRPMTFGFNPGPYVQEMWRVLAEVRPFHWEIEFPEVFYEQDGHRLERPGFHAVLGNPPWDIVKPNSREFFSAYDPSFRELERAAAVRRQQVLLAEPTVSAEWDRHVRTLDAQVAYIRMSDLYPYQSVEVDGKQTGGDANTYKLFLERAFGLLRQGGGCGIVAPSGLYTDQGCTGLRQLFLFRAQISHLLCFENRRAIFPIHRSFKFVLFGFRKLPAADAFNAAFMLRDLQVLTAPESHSIHVPIDLIHRFSPGTYSIMEFRSQRDVDVMARIYDGLSLLGESGENHSRATFGREFHMTDDRGLFNEDGNGWPLFEGKMIHQYTHAWDLPRYWVEPSHGIAELARREMTRMEDELDKLIQSERPRLSRGTRQDRVAALFATLGRGQLNIEDVRCASEAARLAFRAVASNTNERTLIAAILPQHTFQGHSLYYLAPWEFDPHLAVASPHQMRRAFKPALRTAIVAYLCGLLNSFALDYALRFKVSSNVNMFHVYELPVPRLMPGDPRLEAISERVGRLVCVGQEFDELRRELLGDVNAHVATDEGERQALKNEIDALVAHLYGLSEDDLRHILYAPYTFRLVKREIKDAVMEAFAKLGKRMMSTEAVLTKHET